MAFTVLVLEEIEKYQFIFYTLIQFQLYYIDPVAM